MANVRDALTDKWTAYVADYPKLKNDRKLIQVFQALLRQLTKDSSELQKGISEPTCWDDVRHLAREIIHLGKTFGDDTPMYKRKSAIAILHKVIELAENAYGDYEVPPKTHNNEWSI